MAREETDYLQSLGPRPLAWLSVALAWVAGYVDIISWTLLAHIYTSHMTGNTASLSHAFAQADWRKAWSYGWPILCFLSGLIAGAFIIQIGKRRRFHSTLAFILGLEVLLLGLLILFGLLFLAPGSVDSQNGWEYLMLLGLPAAAMGLQTVTLTRVGRLRVYTTYITGTLSKLAESLAEYCLWVYDTTRGPFFQRIGPLLRLTPRQESFQHLVLTVGLWAGFALGAVCGALALRAWYLPALGIPIAILLLLALVDAARPVSLAHEPIEGLWLHEMLPPRQAHSSRLQSPVLLPLHRKPDQKGPDSV